MIKKNGDKIKVSCIIPAYNEEKNIERVLKVVCKYKKFHEIIVMNDGSKDNTAMVVGNFQRKCQKLKLFTNQKNLGKTDNVKKGFLWPKEI